MAARSTLMSTSTERSDLIAEIHQLEDRMGFSLSRVSSLSKAELIDLKKVRMREFAVGRR